MVLLLTVAGSELASAHDPGLSTLELRLRPGELFAHLTFAKPDLTSLLSFASDTGMVEALAQAALDVRVDGNRVAARRAEGEIDETTNAIHLRMTYALRPGARLDIRSLLLVALPRGHRQYAGLYDATGRISSHRMLTADSDALEVTPTVDVVEASSFLPFLRLGIDHIATGYDHLLFLLALLIVDIRFLASARIITSFTVAHSITLGLATFDKIQLPPGWVEPLIALSIVYVGMENLLGRNRDRRWLLTFGFGLVHGLGFASALRELGVGHGGHGLAAALLSFNLGVEVGQVVIAAVVLPLAWRLRQWSTRSVPVLSVLIVLLGGYWFLARTVW